MIIFKEVQIKQIYDHALTIYPEECCGILFGKIDNQPQEKIVIKIWETENNWGKDPETFNLFSHNNQPNLSKKNRFSIAPKILFKAQKYARDQEFAIIGFYHSHPDYLAIPSAFDRSIAWPNYSYLIVSLARQQIKEVKSWSLDETDQFQQEKMLILPV